MPAALLAHLANRAGGLYTATNSPLPILPVSAVPAVNLCASDVWESMMHVCAGDASVDVYNALQQIKLCHVHRKRNIKLDCYFEFMLLLC